MNCRHCDHFLKHVFLDLGSVPPSNAYLTDSNLKQPESQFPLKLFVCDQCWLVQTEDFTRPDELLALTMLIFPQHPRAGWSTPVIMWSRCVIDLS